MILFKKFFAPITLLLCFTLSLSLTGCSASSAQPFSKTGFYFDTVISLTCYGNDAQTVLNEAFELCEHYDNLLSYTKEGSDIWNINHAKMSLQDFPPPGQIIFPCKIWKKSRLPDHHRPLPR